MTVRPGDSEGAWGPAVPAPPPAPPPSPSLRTVDDVAGPPSGPGAVPAARDEDPSTCASPEPDDVPLVRDEVSSTSGSPAPDDVPPRRMLKDSPPRTKVGAEASTTPSSSVTSRNEGSVGEAASTASWGSPCSSRC